MTSTLALIAALTADVDTTLAADIAAQAAVGPGRPHTDATDLPALRARVAFMTEATAEALPEDTWSSIFFNGLHLPDDAFEVGRDAYIEALAESIA